VKKIWIAAAFILAPIAVPIVLTISLLIGPIGFGSGLRLASYFGLFGFSLLVAYPVEIVIGLPV